MVWAIGPPELLPHLQASCLNRLLRESVNDRPEPLPEMRESALSRQGPQRWGAAAEIQPGLWQCSAAELRQVRAWSCVAPAGPQVALSSWPVRLQPAWWPPFCPLEVAGWSIWA